MPLGRKLPITYSVSSSFVPGPHSKSFVQGYGVKHIISDVLEISSRQRKMSSSLKERLKRSGRHTSSPMASPLTSKKVAKSRFTVPASPVCSSVTDRASIMNEENANNLSSTLIVRSLPASLDEIKACDDKEKLREMLTSLTALKTEQEEKLRKLKMAQLYRSKHDPDQFEKLIEKWRLTVQGALKKLHEILPEPKPELTELINHLQIEHELIGYNKDDESFL